MGRSGARGPDGKRGTDLVAVARGLWPTPTVTGNSNRKGASPNSGDGLGTAVKRELWPTPTASEATGPGRGKARQGGPNLRTEVAAQWPTPTASEGANRNTKRCPSHGKTHGKVLAGEVNHRATPTARDWKSGAASEETLARNSRPLSEQVGAVQPGRLNPAWVEQLMGFPDGWTEGSPPDPASPSENGKRRARPR